MLQGQTATKDGYEVMLFPFDYLNCTQGYGYDTYSHCCNYATDWVAPDGSAGYPYYAPCTCIQLAAPYGADNICTYRSADRVWTPSGLRYVSFCFMHDENPPTFSEQIIQGTIIGRTGNAGTSSAPHAHLDQCSGMTFNLVGAGYGCSVGGECFYPTSDMKPENTYFLTGDEQIVDTKGITYDVYDGNIHFRTFSTFKPVLYVNKRSMMRKRGRPWR